MDDIETTRILVDLLTRAARAHGVHEKEQLGGVYDENWPDWYAEHMSRALAESGYRIEPQAAPGSTDSPARS